MKGQLFTMDFIVAISIFISVIISLVFVLNFIIPYNPLEEDLRTKAFSVSDFLITQYIGTENVLDCSKLYDVAFKNYSQIKTELNVNPYDVWIKLENITTNLCPTLRPNLDLMLVIDRSSSMDDNCPGGDADPGETPCKINDAKTASKQFVDNLNESHDQTGLISFSTWTGTPNQTLLTMTASNKTTLKNKIDELTPFGLTNIGDAIRNAAAELVSVRARSEKTTKVQILLSDGQPNMPPPPPGYCQQGENITVCWQRYAGEYALIKAKEACVKSIKIYTISLGNESTGEANRTLMQQIANITGGKEYWTPNSTELVGIFQEISKELNVTRDIGRVPTSPVTNLASVVRLVNLGGKKLKITVNVYKRQEELECT